MKIGEVLKNKRLKNNITQEELAKKLYVSRQTISRWEQGRTIPNIEVLKELSKLYNVTLNELISEEEVIKMKKINILALIGSVFFNIYITLIVAILLVLVLGISWFMTGIFVVSPIILLITVVFGIQTVSVIQVLLTILLCIGGIIAFFILKKATILLIVGAKKYVKFNLKAIIVNK